jgi:hypothetical protein
VRNLVLDLKCHLGSVPNERDGMSVIAFSLPLMFWGVSGQHRCVFFQGARAATRFAAMME